MQVSIPKLFQIHAGPIPRINAFYGRGIGPIWLDYLTCTGNETDLLKCSHNGIGVTGYFCGHNDDVGVQCPGNIECGNCDVHIEIKVAVVQLERNIFSKFQTLIYGFPIRFSKC